MTTGLSAIGPRLAKLLPLLASDQPGEVVATARAIGQTLQRGGMDWHDLAALVSGEGKRQASPAFTFASLPPRTARKQIALLSARPTLTMMDRVRLEQLCLWLHGQVVSVRLPADQVASCSHSRLQRWLEQLSLEVRQQRPEAHQATSHHYKIEEGPLIPQRLPPGHSLDDAPHD